MTQLNLYPADRPPTQNTCHSKKPALQQTARTFLISVEVSERALTFGFKMVPAYHGKVIQSKLRKHGSVVTIDMT
ncbi:hypothetical protein BAY42_09675 [Lacticaseibacillus rhamnosus]|nr:hypothetical protein BAY42_09675 [Lacticaseibacillus rhamnosus]